MMDEIDFQSLKVADTTPYFALIYLGMTFGTRNHQVLARHGPHGLIITHKQPLRVPWRGTRSSTN